nr:MAG: hypothetical protein 3 [Leviviridae sp.]
MSLKSNWADLVTEIRSNLPSVVYETVRHAVVSDTSLVMRMNNEALSANDTLRVVESYIQLTLLQFDVLSHFPRSLQVGQNAYYKYIANLIRRDVYETFQQLANFKDWIQHFTPIQSHVSVRAARKTLVQKGVDIKHPVFDLLRPVIYQYVSSYRFFLSGYESKAMEYFKYLYDFACLISRVTLEDVSSIEDAMIQKYLDQEEDMKTWEYDSTLVDELRAVCISRLDDFCLISDVSAYPDMHHSNGATSECRRGVGLEEKYKNMRIPKEFYFYFKRCTGLDLLEWPGVSLCESDELSSRIQFVPKGIDKKRVISMEPTGLVFVQNAMFRSFDELFKRHPEYRIDLHDQEKSRRLVTVGAKDGLYATIDLSAASDSVTISLLRGVFRDHWILPWLELSRTAKGELETGQCVEYEKAYPMGSPLCFPIECFIFSSICELACKRLGVDADYRIYGDDIIVLSTIYKEVVYLLGKFHFSVNSEKSFAPCEFFKESCGAESFHGYDVSPCRISRRFDIVAVESARYCYVSPAIVGAVELHNRYASFGYPSVAYHLASIVTQKIPFIAYTEDPNCFGLLCKVAKNDHLISLVDKGFRYRTQKSSKDKNGHVRKKVRYYDLFRWNSSLQRFEVLYPVWSLRRNTQDRNIRYFETLRTLDRRTTFNDEEPLNVYVGNTKEMTLRMAYVDYISVNMTKPIHDIPLCPPEYWKCIQAKLDCICD